MAKLVLRCRGILIVFFTLLSASLFAKPTSKKKEKKPGSDQSIVLLNISRAKSQTESPWTFDIEKTRDLSGLVVDSRRILTLARPLVQAQQIDVRLPGDSGHLYQGKVAVFDRERGLALIEVDQDLFPTRSKAEFAADLGLNEEVKQYAFKAKGHFQVQSLRVADVVLQRSGTGNGLFSQYVFKSSQKSARAGDFFFNEQGVAGIITQVDDEQIFALPVSTLQRFLLSRSEQEMEAPWLGVETETFKTPIERRYLGLPEDTRGVYVAKVAQGVTAFQVDDVITAVQGRPIDDKGQTLHPMWGALPFRWIYEHAKVGEKISFKIFRKGKAEDLEVPLIAHDSRKYLVPQSHDVLDYTIVGGFLFEELNSQILESFGRDWSRRAPVEFLYFWDVENQWYATKQARVVILQRVLADLVNQGYDKKDNLILSAVNDQPVLNLTELRANVRKNLLKISGEEFVTFTFVGEGGKVVLPMNALREAEKRIASVHSIPFDEHFSTYK